MKAPFRWLGLAVATLLVFGIYIALQTGQESTIVASGTARAVFSAERNFQMLFLIVHDAESPSPMPYAVARRQVSTIPEGPWEDSFQLGPHNMQVLGANPPRRIRLKVRLDADGLAGPDQPEDYVGEANDLLWGARNVEVELRAAI